MAHCCGVCVDEVPLLCGKARELVLSMKHPTYEKPDGRAVETLVEVEVEEVEEVVVNDEEVVLRNVLVIWDVLEPVSDDVVLVVLVDWEVVRVIGGEFRPVDVVESKRVEEVVEVNDGVDKVDVLRVDVVPSPFVELVEEVEDVELLLLEVDVRVDVASCTISLAPQTAFLTGAPRFDFR